MSSDGSGWQLHSIETGSGTVNVRVRGSGPALWVLPRDNGYASSMDFFDGLAKTHTVHAAYLPGYTGGRDSDFSWATNVRDITPVLGAAIRATGTRDASLLGLGFGGWLALELLLADPSAFSRAVLVSPLGLRPNEGVIFDQFLVNSELYARRMYHDPANFQSLYGEYASFEQLEAWEDDREMSCRVAWKPHMHDPSLPRLLPLITVPVAIVHGENDRIVPPEASDLMAGLLGNATVTRWSARSPCRPSRPRSRWWIRWRYWPSRPTTIRTSTSAGAP